DRPPREDPWCYLKRSSKALRALSEDALPLELPLAGDDADGAVLVWRSTVVRGVISAQLLRASFGATRAGILSFCAHSQRALVSKNAHWMQLWMSTPHLEHESRMPTGVDSRFPQRAQRNTSCAAIRFGVLGPRSSCSTRPGARSFGGAGRFSPRGWRSR